MPHTAKQTAPVTEVQAPGGAHVVVTLESIYALVLQTSDGVSQTILKLDNAASTLSDHEGRIRNLEKRVYLWAGAIGAAAGGVANLLLAAGGQV